MKKNDLFFFMHPVTKKVCDIHQGRSLWEDHKDKADWVVVKVQGPAMDHWEEAMNYGIGQSQPKDLDFSKYREKDYGSLVLFKTDALEAVGIAKHPKADLIFSRAFEYGSEKGYQEVFHYLQDLALIVKE